MTTPKAVALYLVGLAGCFLLWTLAIYFLHRLAHWRHKHNPLHTIHRSHHCKPYLRDVGTPSWPDKGQYYFWLGDWPSSLDVIVCMTLPLVAIAIWLPQYGVPLLVFHYFYEVFVSESVLDHNPRVQGRVTRYLAWGEFHLYHHVSPHRNYGLMITLWDVVFGTARHPQPGSVMHRIESHAASRRARVAAATAESTRSG